MSAPPAPGTAGWRAVHVGFADDGLVIGGNDVWQQRWRRVDLPSVELPHPAHPAQRHRYDIYEIGDAAAPVRFAVGELSNGVWGFYIADGTQDRDCRIAPDGSIRVDLAAAEWSNTHWVYSPRVTEIATGRVLLDLWNTDWDASVSFPGERRVRLDMRRYHHGGGLAVEFDLARDSCRIDSVSGHPGVFPETPLADVASTLEAASRLAAAAAGARPPVPARSPWAAWRTALIILIAALLLIAAATWLSLQLAPAAPAQLTPLPEMPKFGG